MADVDLVVPTIGRPSLRALLASLAASSGVRPAHIMLVDDRRDRGTPLELGEIDDDVRARITVLAGRAGGPASARNVGWRASRAAWVAFVDDDVLLSDTWLADLEADLHAAGPDTAASQGRVSVPLPNDRRATDWERNVRGLESSLWITADCAYRRSDLLAVGGFDERFPRAFREDADLALRVIASGRGIAFGTRRIVHPVRPADRWVSVRLQAGNADDVLMDALHGDDWYERAGAPRGAYPQHMATVACAAGALALGAAWLVLAARFTVQRIAPGPRTRGEIATLVPTSLAIPFAAVWHRLRARCALRSTLADRARAPRPLPAAVLFDRDGTLVVDVPFNGDPACVEPMPDAAGALARLRAAGVATAMVSNQSGVAAGRISPADVDAVNARVDVLLGGVGPALYCPHAPADGCACRKPEPGLIADAARALGVAPEDCVVVGDIGSDVDAACAAGARAILVPTAVTLRAEIDAAPLVARTLHDAVDLVLGGAA